MSINATIRLDRAAAILAGRTDFGEKVVALHDADLAEMTEAERRLLADLATDQGRVDLSVCPLRGADYPVLTEASAASVRTVLAALAAHVAAETAKAETARADAEWKWAEAQRAWLARPDAELIEADGERVVTPDEGRTINPTNSLPFEAWAFSPFVGLPVDRAVLDRLERLKVLAREMLDRRQTEQAARRLSERLAAEARDAEAATARARALEGALEARGTEGQRKRHARGLLGQDELLALYRDHVFAPLESFARYERITKAEIEHALGLGDGDREDWQFDVSAAGAATDAEFATLLAIEEVAKARLPEGVTCQLREHNGGYIGVDYWIITRRSVLVAIEAPVKVSREYACP